MTTEKEIEDNDNQEDAWKNYPRPGDVDNGNWVALGLVGSVLLVLGVGVVIGLAIAGKL